MKPIHRFLRSATGARLVDTLMAIRTIPLLGNRQYCPCCGWHIRTFTRGNYSYSARIKGYCPRCNSKPRHRFLWHHISSATTLLANPIDLLDISPAYSIARRLLREPQIRYFSCDLEYRPFVQFFADLTRAALPENRFDVILCIHVLEHIADDRAAIAELFRMTRAGGTAVVAVPVRMDQATVEDAAITDPAERRRLFGEADHVRWYGHDLLDRLERAGFAVEIVRADGLEQAVIEQYGLKAEEVMFYCRKPVA
jgi:SAM-dependent methyltransferase